MSERRHVVSVLGCRRLVEYRECSDTQRNETWYWLGGAVRLERTLERGVVTGAWREFWRDGRPALQLEFVAGKLQGPCKRWRRDGTRLCVGQFLDGRMDGDWFFLHKDGKLDVARTGVYREGLRISGIKGFNEWLGSP